MVRCSPSGGHRAHPIVIRRHLRTLRPIPIANMPRLPNRAPNDRRRTRIRPTARNRFQTNRPRTTRHRPLRHRGSCPINVTGRSHHKFRTSLRVIITINRNMVNIMTGYPRRINSPRRPNSNQRFTNLNNRHRQRTPKRHNTRRRL